MWRSKAGSTGKPLPIPASYGAADRPLVIGEVQIPCYVLADGTRVLAQNGLLSGIGMSQGGGKGGERKIVELMLRLAGKGIDVRGLVARANSPIRFIPPHGGNPAVAPVIVGGHSGASRASRDGFVQVPDRQPLAPIDGDRWS